MEDKEWVLKNVEEICADTRDIDEVCMALEHSTIFATEIIQNLTKTILDLQQELDRANEKLKKIEDICDNEIQKYDWLIQEAKNNNDKEMFYTPIQYHSKINELKIILGIIEGDD